MLLIVLLRYMMREEISIVPWPWSMRLNPTAAWIFTEPHSFKRDPSTTQPYVYHSVHLLQFFQKKSPPTTSVFFFNFLSHVVFVPSATVLWGTWHRALHFQRGLIINMPIPAELSDIYSPRLWKSVHWVLRIQLCIWNSLCTACSKSATGKHTGSAAGVLFGLFASE